MRKTFLCLWLIGLLLSSYTKMSFSSSLTEEDPLLQTKAAITKARFSCTRMFYPLKVQLVKSTSPEAKVFIKELDELKESIANFLKLIRDGYLPSIPLVQLKEHKGLKFKLQTLKENLGVDTNEDENFNLNQVLIEYAFKSTLNSMAARRKIYPNKEVKKCFITYASEKDNSVKFIRKLVKHLQWASMNISVEACNNLNQEKQFIAEVDEANIILLLGSFILMKEYNNKNSVVYSNINYIYNKQQKSPMYSVIPIILEKESKNILPSFLQNQTLIEFNDKNEYYSRVLDIIERIYNTKSDLVLKKLVEEFRDKKASLEKESIQIKHAISSPQLDIIAKNLPYIEVAIEQIENDKITSFCNLVDKLDQEPYEKFLKALHTSSSFHLEDRPQCEKCHKHWLTSIKIEGESKMACLICGHEKGSSIVLKTHTSFSKEPMFKQSQGENLKEIKILPNEKELNLSNKKLSVGAFLDIAKILKENPSIKHLNLSQCDIDDMKTLTLAGSLINLNSSLKKIDLSHNKIENKGAESLLALLENNQKKFNKIIKIKLKGNKIEESIMQKIKEIRHTQGIDSLILSSILLAVKQQQSKDLVLRLTNKDEKDIRETYLKQAYEKKLLEEKDIQFITKEWGVNLLKLAVEKQEEVFDASKILEKIQECLRVNADTLDLSFSTIPPQSYITLEKKLEDLPALMHLNLSYSHIDDSAMIDLNAMLSNLKIHLNSLDLRHNHIEDRGAADLLATLKYRYEHHEPFINVNLEGNKISSDLLQRFKAYEKQDSLKLSTLIFAIKQHKSIEETLKFTSIDKDSLSTYCEKAQQEHHIDANDILFLKEKWQVSLPSTNNSNQANLSH